MKVKYLNLGVNDTDLILYITTFNNANDIFAAYALPCVLNLNGDFRTIVGGI